MLFVMLMLPFLSKLKRGASRAERLREEKNHEV